MQMRRRPREDPEPALESGQTVRPLLDLTSNLAAGVSTGVNVHVRVATRLRLDDSALQCGTHLHSDLDLPAGGSIR